MSGIGEVWTTQVTRLLAPNPGPMTLDGTNSLLVRAPGSAAVVVVDPGPDDAGHLDRLADAGEVALILLTHHHGDHVAAAAPLAARTGAPVRALSAQPCIDAPPLSDGERMPVAGVELEVVATPGHTADSVSFLLRDDTVPGAARRGSMITGDTILGRGTTIIAEPDGSLAAYLSSLDRLEAHGALTVLPAHGPMLPDLEAICTAYRSHRLERLDQLRGVLDRLRRPATGDPSTVRAIVDAVYGDVAPEIRFAAEASTRAQLAYLAQHD